MQPVTHKDKQYYCNTCNVNCNYPDVHKDWKCPKCNDKIRIKIPITDGLAQSCYRIHHSDLKEGDYITLESNFIYRVGSITKEVNDSKLFLEGYGPYTAKDKDMMTVIEGGWS